MRAIKTAVGLMSGTSLDGIDAALLQTDGADYVLPLGCRHYPYSAAFRRALQQGLQQAQAISRPDERPGRLAELEQQMTRLHARAVAALLRQQHWPAEKVALIGFHGQTVLHRPPLAAAAGKTLGEYKAFTAQLGDGALLARQTGIDTINDMRSNDMRHGGNGAPLVPVYHRALAAKLRGKCAFPLLFVNIGGIANATYIGEKEGTGAAALIAFDCGPGNVLLDQWAEAKSGSFFDEGGQAAQKGQILPWLTAAYGALPIFQQQRRSFDRLDFPPLDKFLSFYPEKSVSYEDGAASLAFITAQYIMDSCKALPQAPKTMLVSGGGAKNRAIMTHLQKAGADLGVKTVPAAAFGLDSDFMEAEAWGYLAVRSFYHLPLSYPATTGCAKPVSGGVFHPAPLLPMRR